MFGALGARSTGQLTETAIAQAMVARGLTDAQARAAISGAASLPAGLRAVGLLPAATPTPTPSVTPLPAGLVNRLMVADMPAQADGTTVASMTDSAGAVFALAAGAPKYRTGGGTPYIEAADGDRLTLPVDAGAGAALKALIATRNFTIIVFVDSVASDGRRYGSVLGSFGDVNNHLLVKVDGQRAGFFRGALSTLDYPWPASSDPLAIAMVSDAAYAFKNTTEGLDRLFLNGSCVQSMASDNTHTIAADGLSLFGIQNGIADGNFAGRYRGHLIFDRPLTPASVRQVLKWDGDHTGRPVPWADAPAIYTGFENSIGNGYLSPPEFSPMSIVASINNWPLGWWENLSVDSQNLRGMLANASRDLYGTAAITGKTHELAVTEYANSVIYSGFAPAQAAQDLATLVADFKAASPNSKVFVETPTNAQTEIDNNHVNYDPFVAAVLTIPCDGFVRVDQDPAIGRSGDVTNAANFQPSDRLHLVGNAGPCGNRIKAGLMAPAFAAA